VTVLTRPGRARAEDAHRLVGHGGVGLQVGGAGPDVVEIVLIGVGGEERVDLRPRPVDGEVVVDVRRQADEAGQGQRGARVGDVLFRDHVAGDDDHRWVPAAGFRLGQVAAHAGELHSAVGDRRVVEDACRWRLRRRRAAGEAGQGQRRAGDETPSPK